MTNGFEDSNGFEKHFGLYVSVWKDIFTNPIAFFAEESRNPSYHRITAFAVSNFIIAGILGWLFLGSARDFGLAVRILIGFPLAFALMSVFNAAVYMVCLRTIGTAADYKQLFKISLVIASIAAIPATLPFLMIPSKLLALVLFCLAFIGVFEMSVGRAIWATLTPAVFLIIIALYITIMYRLLVPDYFQLAIDALRAAGI